MATRTNPADYLSYPILKRGMSKPEVKLVKALLRSQGFWSGTDSADYGPKMQGAVAYFQGTHLGPDGQFLMGDGEVGPRTWWALYNPLGVAQKSFVAPPRKDEAGIIARYAGLSDARRRYLHVLFQEWEAGTHEIPDGSNQGDGVDKIIAGCGPIPWCCAFVSWGHKTANGSYPKGSRELHVQTFWNKALKGGYGFKKGKYLPVPGDSAVWCFPGGTGHITTVTARNMDCSKFNSIGGNESNRVKHGLRNVGNEPRLAGFINPFPLTEKNEVENRLFTVDEEQAMRQDGTR